MELTLDLYIGNSPMYYFFYNNIGAPSFVAHDAPLPRSMNINAS